MRLLIAAASCGNAACARKCSAKKSKQDQCRVIVFDPLQHNLRIGNAVSAAERRVEIRQPLCIVINEDEIVILGAAGKEAFDAQHFAIIEFDDQIVAVARVIPHSRGVARDQKICRFPRCANDACIARNGDVVLLTELHLRDHS